MTSAQNTQWLETTYLDLIGNGIDKTSTNAKYLKNIFNTLGLDRMNDTLRLYLGVRTSSLILFNKVCTNPDDVAIADTFWHTHYLELKQSSISETIGTLPIVNKKQYGELVCDKSGGDGASHTLQVKARSDQNRHYIVYKISQECCAKMTE